MPTRIPILVVLVFLFGGLRYTAAQAHYAVIDMGNLGEAGVFAQAINSSGQVAGWCYTLPDDYPHAFSYRGGVMVDLGTLGGNPPVEDSEAAAINDSGQVAGWSWNSAGAMRAFLYSGGTMRDLGTLGGPTASATSINSSGQIVGASALTGGSYPPQHAFLYSGGAMQDLGTLGSGSNSYAYGINDSGQVVGASNYTSSSYYSHAFLYSGGVMHDLGALGTDTNSFACGINDRGQIAGTSYSDTTSGTVYTAFLYSNGTMQSLGTLGGSMSYSYAINDSGEVVGYYYSTLMTNVEYGHAFVDSGGTMTDLNGLIDPALGLTVEQATTVNDEGWIAVSGHPTKGSRVSCGYLLVPLPAGASQTGDANLDGRVDMNDLTIVLANFGKTTGMSWGTGDFNGDGTVDVNDLTAVLSNFGQVWSASAPSVSAVPEPSGLMLLGLAAAALFSSIVFRTGGHDGHAP